MLFALVLVALWRLVHSPFGRVLRAIKQNEMRAAFVGHNVWLYKWLRVRHLGRRSPGLAGALFALAQQSAYPNVMSLHNSGFVVMMVLIGGGLVSFWGPVIGALFFILARDLLGAYTETWLLWYGLLFMAMVLFQPEGIAGAVAGVAPSRRGTARQGGGAAPTLPAEREGRLTRWPLFEATHLHKRFGDQVVLRGRVAARSRRPSCRASWARTAPARPPASTCSPAATARPRPRALRRRGHHRPAAAAASRARGCRARSR